MRWSSVSCAAMVKVSSPLLSFAGASLPSNLIDWQPSPGSICSPESTSKVAVGAPSFGMGRTISRGSSHISGLVVVCVVVVSCTCVSGACAPFFWHAKQPKKSAVARMPARVCPVLTPSSVYERGVWCGRRAHSRRPRRTAARRSSSSSSCRRWSRACSCDAPCRAPIDLARAGS